MNIYFAEPSQNKLSASHIYAWKLGLKTGQYYLRSRPARDAIQFTLDVDTLDAKEDGNYNTKNLSKAEMDAAKRLKKKRTAPEPVAESKVIAPASTDLNKKGKTTDTSPSKNEKETKEQKPGEGKEEQEKDYRWDICENCQ